MEEEGVAIRAVQGHPLRCLVVADNNRMTSPKHAVPVHKIDGGGFA
jgi:hypothetical protein